MLSWALVLQLMALLTDAPIELWDYRSPDLWNNYFPMCNGPLQSPIDLQPGPVANNDRLKLEMAPGLMDGEMEAWNNGRVARFYYRPENRSQPIARFSSLSRPLFGTYRFEHMDYHWTIAAGSTPGSEHSIAGRFGDAEAQLVFVNEKFSTFAEALKHPGGVAILGIILDGIEPPAMPQFPTFGFEPMIEEVAPKGARITFAADLSQFEMLLRVALSKTFTYHGSLTYPPCSPVVLWLIAANSMTVHLEFVTQLNGELFEDELMQVLMVDNFRPTQKSAGRKVTQTFNIIA